MRVGSDVGKIVDKERIEQDEEWILLQHLSSDLKEGSDLSNFEKPCKPASQKGKIESIKQSKRGQPK